MSSSRPVVQDLWDGSYAFFDVRFCHVFRNGVFDILSNYLSQDRPAHRAWPRTTWEASPLAQSPRTLRPPLLPYLPPLLPIPVVGSDTSRPGPRERHQAARMCPTGPVGLDCPFALTRSDSLRTTSDGLSLRPRFPGDGTVTSVGILMTVSLSRRRERREAGRVTRRAGAQRRTALPARAWRAEASRGMQSRGGQKTHKLPQKTNPTPPPGPPLPHRVWVDCEVRAVPKTGASRPWNGYPACARTVKKEILAKRSSCSSSGSLRRWCRERRSDRRHSAPLPPSA